MFHPDARVKVVNDRIGYGVYATEFIPEGTITYIKDSLEIIINEDNLEDYSISQQDVIEKYSYVQADGSRVLSWDIAKYVNHCCDPNTISTGYGFEMAIKDINPGEQITDEYALFNLSEPMAISCRKPGCRKMVSPDDVYKYCDVWDMKIKKSLKKLNRVFQPLIDFMEEKELRELQEFFKDESKYKSVSALIRKPVEVNGYNQQVRL